MKATAAPIPFAGSVLTEYRHACAFFSSPQEEYVTILPFVLDGLQRGERAYHVLRSPYREKHLEELRNAGIDVVPRASFGQLSYNRPGVAGGAGASLPHAHFLWLPRRLLSAWSGVRAWTFPITRFSLSPRNDATTGIGSH
jgi:hypothetical protein